MVHDASPLYCQSNFAIKCATMAVVFLLGVFFIVYSNTVKSESDILIYFYAGLSFFIYSVLFLIFDPSYSIEITTEDITILRQNRLWEARTEIISKKSIRAATLVQSNLLGVVFYDIPYRDWETDRKSTRLNSSHRL